MKTLKIFLLLNTLILTSGVQAMTETRGPGKPTPVPGSWIVQLAAEPTMEFRGAREGQLQGVDAVGDTRSLAATAPEVLGKRRFDAQAPEVQAYSEFLDQERHSVLDHISERLGRQLKPERVYRHLLNGFAVRMSAEEAARVADMPGVVSVRQDMAYSLELEEGPGLIGAPLVWSGIGVDANRGEGVVIGVIDSGINWDHAYFSDSPSQSGGYVYENPFGEQLGECSKPSVPCNNKLVGVWDFTEDSTDGLDIDGHGTHVASIAAGIPIRLDGTDRSFRTSGVAPRAHIVSYRVCALDEEEEEVRCRLSAINDALEQAVTDGVDIINYSIGGGAGDPWDQDRQFLNVFSAGVLFVTSAGNAGPEPASISSPANAPWTLAVASVAHQRRFGNKATVAGISDILVVPGTGPELTDDLTAPVIAADSVAEDLLGCDPFDDGVFDGAIAFLSRGDCTFETKVNNAADAGAEAVLVFNHEDGADPLTMAGLEETSIPAVMMGNTIGLQVLDAINDASDPTATLFAETGAIVDPDRQDGVSNFSSRGPGVGSPNVMKPNVAGPGQDILAGWVPDEDDFQFVSGTSMASPHVAGAAALLKSTFPDWTPAMLQSALETTAMTDSVTVGDAVASMFDRGAGRVRVDRAINAGLYLPIDTQDFIDANPGEGGDPGQLNLAGIYAGDCMQDCEFTRTVRALQSGSWNVLTEGELDIEVSPSSFSLSQGASQQLTITVSSPVEEFDGVLDGSIVLTPDSGGLSTQRLPVGMSVVSADLPDRFQIDAPANRGRGVVEIDVFRTMLEAVYRTSSLVRPVEESFTLRQDPTPNDPFDGEAGTQTFLVDVPENTLLLWAETVASSAPDIDLFVGYDANGDGQAELDEMVCQSITLDELEECLIEQPQPGTWWILVQNWEASNPLAEDSVELEYAILTEGHDYSLAASGPPRHQAGPLELMVAWDQPAMRRDERWLGVVGLATSADELADVGVIPLVAKRTETATPQSTAIFSGETYPVVVAPGATHDLLFFDVSPAASQVSVDIQGDAGMAAELRYMEFDEVAGYAPQTPTAGGESVVSGSGSEAGFNLSADARPGRWYVVLDNSATDEGLVEVSVEITESEPVRSQRGLWSPRDRVIYQGIEWQSAGPGFMTWYSYDLDGLPVFYQAVADIDASSSAWTAPMDRIGNPTGNRQLYDSIGEVSLTMLSDEEMIFAWRRDGFHGSEIMAPDAARTCPEVDGETVSYSGHWYSPDNLVGGTTMIVTENVQAHVRYYFDALGVGRWLLASDPESDPLNEELELLDFRGFCPGCEETDVDIHEVGFYTRTFESESSGTESLEFVTAEPLDHAIGFEVPISKLSEKLECQ